MNKESKNFPKDKKGLFRSDDFERDFSKLKDIADKAKKFSQDNEQRVFQQCEKID